MQAFTVVFVLFVSELIHIRLRPMGGHISIFASSSSGDPIVGSATGGPPDSCLLHFRPALNVYCAVCSSVGDVGAGRAGLCTGCIREHSIAHPTHVLASFAPGASFLRAAFVALVPSNAVAQRGMNGEIATTSSSSSTPVGLGVGKPFRSPPEMSVPQDAAMTPPLVDCARRRALVIQTELDALATNTEVAFNQLEENRDAALAALECGTMAVVGAQAVLAAFSTGVDAVQASSTLKRVALEAELVAADAALGIAMDTTTTLAEVRERRRSRPHI